MDKRTWALVLAGCVGWMTSGVQAEPAKAGGLTLVDKGKSLAPIVIFKGAPPFTRRAADELAAYIDKISGAKPPVIEGQPDPLPQHAIWVGFQPVLTNLFPAIDFQFKYPEEILIAANDKHVVIAGRDRWDPRYLVATGRFARAEGIQQEYGTINAVYTFLQDNLGVRWLWPGELGEDVPRQATLAVAPFEYRYHPQIRGRSGVFHYSSVVRGGYGQSMDWTRFQRLQLSSLSLEGGHGFGDWWDRFHKDHPEYFALQPDGTRSGFPGPRTAKLCESNPAVVEQWLAQVAEQLQKDPTRTIFNASPNDSWASGHCMCTNCRAWDQPDGEPRLFHWKGLSKEYVSLADRDVTFANRCAQRLKQQYPDKDYYVMMMSYGHSRPPPLKAVPADNVIISSVANFLGRDGLVDNGSTRGVTYKEQYEGWAKVAPQLIWRPNTGSPAGWQQGQPDVSLTQTIEDFKFVASNKCIGIFIDAVWEHWATHGPEYYVMAQLTWNPAQDGRAILDDYYRRGFGKAAADLKAYWDLMEATRQTFVAKDCRYSEVYDAAFFDKAYGLLSRATNAVAGEPELYRRRVEFVRAGLDYTRLIVAIRDLMDQFRKSGKKDAAVEAKVRANWKDIERIVQEHPYAINWGPVRPLTPRMAGLHPDYAAAPKKKPAQFKTPAKQPANDMDLN